MTAVETSAPPRAPLCQMLAAADDAYAYETAKDAFENALRAEGWAVECGHVDREDGAQVPVWTCIRPDGLTMALSLEPAEDTTDEWIVVDVWSDDIWAIGSSPADALREACACTM